MAPPLAQSTREMAFDMTVSSELTAPQMAVAASCHMQTIKRYRSNIRMFGSVTAPSNKGGRPQSLTPLMIQVLCDHLLEKPQLYLDEMVVFLWDEFQVLVTFFSFLIGVHIICPLLAISIILFSIGRGDKRLLILAIEYKVLDRF